MKTLLKMSGIGVIAIAITGMIFNGINALGRPDREEGSGGYGGRIRAHDKERPMIKMMQRLNLSENQKAQIAEVVKQSMEKMRPQRELVMRERKKLRELMEAEVFDPNAIRAQSQRLAGYEAELNIARAEQRQRIEGILTPEQRGEWRRIREEHRKRVENWQEKGRERWMERRRFGENSGKWGDGLGE